jgi:hypothetical protein
MIDKYMSISYIYERENFGSASVWPQLPAPSNWWVGVITQCFSLSLSFSARFVISGCGPFGLVAFVRRGWPFGSLSTQ